MRKPNDIPESLNHRIALYECDGLIEAHLLKGMLEQCDIDVTLQGESLLGAAGELPASGLLQLWVDKTSVEQARALIAEYESHDVLADGSIIGGSITDDSITDSSITDDRITKRGNFLA